MSGGSFNYASSVCDLKSLIEHLDDLKELSEELDTLAQESRAAVDTGVLLILAEYLDNLIQTKANTLGHVWHELEWWRSGDRGEDDFRKAIVAYEANHK